MSCIQAIQGYKETEKEQWNEENSKVIKRLCELAFPLETVPLKLIHVLDLSKTGHIKPHVDSVKVSMECRLKIAVKIPFKPLHL